MLTVARTQGYFQDVNQEQLTLLRTSRGTRITNYRKGSGFYAVRYSSCRMSRCCAARFVVAYLPAVNIQLGEFYGEVLLRQLPFVVLVQFSSLFLVGAYSILWRYVSIEDLKVFLKAAVISGGNPARPPVLVEFYRF